MHVLSACRSRVYAGVRAECRSCTVICTAPRSIVSMKCGGPSGRSSARRSCSVGATSSRTSRSHLCMLAKTRRFAFCAMVRATTARLAAMMALAHGKRTGSSARGPGHAPCGRHATLLSKLSRGDASSSQDFGKHVQPVASSGGSLTGAVGCVSQGSGDSHSLPESICCTDTP